MIKMSETKKSIPEFDIPLFHTKFRKDDIKYPEIVKEVGLKVLKDEAPHRSIIGNNPSICKKLFGVGQVLNDLPGFGFNFRTIDNHIWLPQPNLKANNKIMDICLNCGSLLIDNKFIPYTDLK